MIMIIY